MNSSQHIELMKKIFDDSIEDLAIKTQEIIDSTAKTVGGLVHRNDMSHDPRIVLGKSMEKGRDLFDWINDAVNGDFEKVKEMTQLHQIQDVSSGKVEFINGHKVTQEMIDQCKEAVDIMEKGSKPDLSQFEWTKKAGKGINTKAAPNAPSGPLLKQFVKTCSFDKLNSAGLKAAKGAAVITAIVSTSTNGYKVFKGEVETIDAVDNVAKDVSCAVVSSYAGAATSTLGAAAVIMLGATPAGWVVLGTALVVGTATGIGVNHVARKAYDKASILKLRWWKDKFFGNEKKISLDVKDRFSKESAEELEFRETYQNVF